MSAQTEVFIVSGCRTPIGNLCGIFKHTPAHELGAIVIKEALERASLKGENVSEVIMGQALTGGQGQNPARLAALKAGIPNFVPAHGVSMLCGSGLKAVHLGYQAIKSSESSIVVCGGQESMSMANHSAFIRSGIKLGDLNLKDNILTDGLTDPLLKMHMGDTAEFLAKKYKVDRKSQDEYAYNSQMKTSIAVEMGYFKNEIVVVPIKDGRQEISIDKDEYPKKSTLEGLAKLKPVFKGDAELTVTPGNASGINDGAAAVVLASGEVVNSLQLKPMAKIKSFAVHGLDPIEMGLGPIEAIKTALKKANYTIDDIDLFELNEAFAVQSLLVGQTLSIPESKLNITGGAIALGHPIGCSGARILVTLLHNLKRLDKKTGVAALCIGGGMGIAIVIEKC